MAVNTIKTLRLTLEGTSVEAQLTRCALVDEPDSEELVTFAGTQTSTIANYNLELAGFQDYGQASSVFQMIYDAYTATPISELDFVVTVGGRTRTGIAKPTSAPIFGGDAGAALAGDIVLDVIGKPSAGASPPIGYAGTPGSWSGTPPATFSAATSAGAIASPTSAWTTGQYVQGSTAGATGEMHWSGTAWTTGRKA